MISKKLIVGLLVFVFLFTAFSPVLAQDYGYNDSFGNDSFGNNFSMDSGDLNTLAWLIPVFIGLFIVWLTLCIGIYVYSALALMAIAKKTNTEPAYLAWIPVANMYLLSKIAGMPWWPMLLMIGFVIPILNIFFGIAFMVFVFIWYWKIFERLDRPGWWVLLNLIPLAGAVIFLVLLGVAAWSKAKV